MRRFKWIDFNLDKIAAHGLSAAEVEAAFDRIAHTRPRRDGSFRTSAETPSGRMIWIIWRYDREGEADALDSVDDPPIFVITAY